MASTQPAHDPALTQVPPAPTGAAPAPGTQPPPSAAPNLPPSILSSVGHEHLAALLKTLPDLFTRVSVPAVPPIVPTSAPAAPPLYAPPVALGCAEHALHVIKGISHVRRDDREGRAARMRMSCSGRGLCDTYLPYTGSSPLPWNVVAWATFGANAYQIRLVLSHTPFYP